MHIGPHELPNRLFVAPMAGVTNSAFRTLCRSYGAGLYVSEMITSRALVERTPDPADRRNRAIRAHQRRAIRRDVSTLSPRTG